MAITATTIAIATATLSSITAPLLCLGDVFGLVGEAMEFARKLLAAMSTVRHHCGPLSTLGEISRSEAPRVRVGVVSPFGAPSIGVGTGGAETTRIDSVLAGERVPEADHVVMTGKTTTSRTRSVIAACLRHAHSKRVVVFE